MSHARIRQIDRRIERIKRALMEIGPMRPGSLTCQFKDREKRTGAYWQISYTRDMKSRTEYARKEYLGELRREIRTYKRFKRLVDLWINLGIERSRIAMQIIGPKRTS